ncbi:DUF4097 family beta strand repeat-containing protein [Atopobacter sp. AH10]|uniref:DUF4097 family beta strand repeat-containing protein n=1 Tax=Atopobacter sp. AH10 TaxID=2315861 RepID=UPI0013143959|nr:DUF4097 family beta strand repeat-containing protein [Atopobacter sp. AH10]
MDKKERIMALLKAGVINEDDALILLEQEGQKIGITREQNNSEEKRQVSQEEMKEEATIILEKAASLSAKIDQEKAQLEQLNELLLHKKDFFKELEAAYADFQQLRDQEKEDLSDGFIPTSVDDLLEADLSTEGQKEEGQEACQEDLDKPFSRYTEKDFVEAIADSREDIDSLTKSIQEKEADISNLSQKMAEIQAVGTSALGEKKSPSSSESKDSSQDEKGREEWKNFAKDTADWVNKVTPSILSAVKVYADRVQEIAEDFSMEVGRSKPSSSKTRGGLNTYQEVIPIDKEASIVDIKLACGKIDLEVKEGESGRLEISYQGVFEDSKSLRDTIEKHRLVRNDLEMAKFHFSSRNIQVAVKLYLSEKNYDYVSLKVISGEIKAESLKSQDILAKVKTGNISFDKVSGTMLESLNTSGKIYLKDCQFRDVFSKLTTGKIYYTGAVQGLDLDVQTGNILLDTDKSLQHVEAKVKTGNIRWYNMDYQSIEADLKSGIGSISHPYLREDMDISIEEERRAGQRLKFRHLKEGTPVIATLSTKLGNIQLTTSQMDKEA